MRGLTVDDVSMIYDLPNGGSVEALRNISFSLDPGDMLAVLGPSGCGKTTLLNIIAGLLQPTAGTLTLTPPKGSNEDGRPIEGPSPERGMIFQQGALFEWLTVAENIGFGPAMKGTPKAEIRDKVDGLLDIVGLKGFGDKAVYELSGGMQQRVALARCLANDPELILMDEPLGALDALTREKMQGLVLKLWHETGTTVVLITHSVEEALFLGQKLFVMAPRPGRIERTYELDFARKGLSADSRDVKASPEFTERREEILSMIWEMEEEIMGSREQEA
ncbi:MAG: ABC transporter ATP-binding protein [Geminicoccaceae bacterium]